MLEHLMKTYALAQGLDTELAEEAGDAREDGGVYSLGFGNALCTFSEECGARGESSALAVCHVRTISAGDSDEEFIAAVRRITGLGLSAVPIFSEEGLSLGLMARLGLAGISDAAFLDWMNDLERMCRSAFGEVETMLPAQREAVGSGPLRMLFEAAGAPLEDTGENLFWRLALPQGVIFLECDPWSGQARLRSLAAGREPSAEELRTMLAFNLGLSGKGWLLEQSGLVWYCSPLPVPSVEEAGQSAPGLAQAIALHLENSRDVSSCLAEGRKDTGADGPADMLFHLMHSLRV